MILNGYNARKRRNIDINRSGAVKIDRNNADIIVSVISGRHA